MDIGIVKSVNLEDEMKGAYLDYAMSVITARALPDVRDGLKPVQRRILYAMDELSLRHSSAHKKSARIVGEVLGKYHPHGDAPVYESMVRMAQHFSMRYPLVDGQGNFGSVDGDPPAAMRYTEARLAAIAEELLGDLDKNTVAFNANFDDSLKEPSVLPAKLPNLLLNGSSGIAVGMATNIPPHNLREVVDALGLIIGRFAEGLEAGVPFNVLWSRVQQTPSESGQLAATLKNLSKPLLLRVDAAARKLAARPSEEQRLTALGEVLDEITGIAPDELMSAVKGPDFPTAGLIVGVEGIKSAYATGHGRITIRAKAHVEDIKGGRSQIVVTELPFQVNKATLLERIAELTRDRRVDGISDLRDESDRQGMRMVVELKRDAQATQILNQLFKHTSLQTTFSVNMLALVDGQPRVLTLKMLLMHYMRYRREVVTRRTEFELDRAKKRAHILEGLKIALDNLDAIIATIRRSADAEAARGALMKGFKLSELQAQAILDMQLRRLAALERKKIMDEYREVLALIGRLEALLAKPASILYVVRDELAELREKYGDERRTRILADETAEFTEEDLIPDQEVAIVLSGKGYVKRVAPDAYRLRRASRGETAIVKDEESVSRLLTLNMLDSLLLFTSKARLLQCKVRDLPDAMRQSRGQPLSSVFQMEEGESVVGLVSSRALTAGSYFLFVTLKGEVKRAAALDYATSRSSGVIAMSLAAGDELVWVGVSNGKDELLIGALSGQTIRFSEQEVRASGRTSGGVRAIRLASEDRVVGAGLAVPGGEVVTVSENGYARRSALDEYPAHGRGGGGVRGSAGNTKTGAVAAVAVCRPSDVLLLSTSTAGGYRFLAEQVTKKGRAAQLASLIVLDKKESVTGLCQLEAKEAVAPEPTLPSGPDKPGGQATEKGPRAGKGAKATAGKVPAAAPKGKAKAEAGQLPAKAGLRKTAVQVAPEVAGGAEDLAKTKGGKKVLPGKGGKPTEPSGKGKAPKAKAAPGKASAADKSQAKGAAKSSAPAIPTGRSVKSSVPARVVVPPLIMPIATTPKRAKGASPGPEEQKTRSGGAAAGPARGGRPETGPQARSQRGPAGDVAERPTTGKSLPGAGLTKAGGVRRGQPAQPVKQKPLGGRGEEREPKATVGPASKRPSPSAEHDTLPLANAKRAGQETLPLANAKRTGQETLPLFDLTPAGQKQRPLDEAGPRTGKGTEDGARAPVPRRGSAKANKPPAKPKKEKETSPTLFGSIASKLVPKKRSPGGAGKKR